MAAAIRRHADAIEYDAFRVPGLLLDAWVAQQRGDGAAAVDAYRRALELAARIDFGDHAAFALSGIGSNALVDGDLRQAEELQRQAVATAEAAHASWPTAHARVQLARIAAAAGDAATAERLYREVLEWSRLERPHQARESLFLALAGSPATAAERGLAELGETALT
jgi:ATP/maltotriose-dependent transcriptional regulator MalT